MVHGNALTSVCPQLHFPHGQSVMESYPEGVQTFMNVSSDGSRITHFLYSLSLQKVDVWIGLSNRTWLDESPFDFNNTHLPMPANESCSGLHWNRNFGIWALSWSQPDCMEHRPFICKQLLIIPTSRPRSSTTIPTHATKPVSTRIPSRGTEPPATTSLQTLAEG